MKKRYVVLGLTVVLALALAVPAFGGPTNPLAAGTAQVKKIANKALKTAKTAQKTANTALATANAANTAAGNADSDATKASTEAKKAQTSATAAQTTANEAKSTANAANTAATAAKNAAAAAEANANTRLNGSSENFLATGADTTASPKSISVECPAGEPVLGGGFDIGGDSNEVTVESSDNELYGHGWFVSANAIAGKTPSWNITGVVMCGTK